MVLPGTAERFDSIAALAEACQMPNLPETIRKLGLADGAYAGGLGPALTMGHITGLTILSDLK